LSIPQGVSIGGEVFDAKTDQYFKLLRPGRLTLAFLYRSDGPATAEEELAKFLKPGEKLWSGKVYSNAVRVNVSRLHVKKPVPPNYTGVWTDYYPSGKKKRVAHYTSGKLDGSCVHYSISGKKHYEDHYKDGVRHGLYVVYDSEGRKSFQQTL